MFQLPIGPHFTLSTTSSLPRSLNWYSEVADELGAVGLDLDATTRVGRIRTGLRSVPDSALFVGLSSIWVSAIDLEPAVRDLERQTPGLIGKNAVREISLAIRLPGNTESHADHLTMQTAREAFELLPWASGVTIVVPAAAPEGGRAHITRLRRLRRLVEEWDMTLGLDLSEATDARWEAEVAIQIAGPRLALVRLRTRMPGALSQASDVRARALVACGDLGFSGKISLVPPTPFWLGWHTPSVRRDLEHNRDTVTRILAERRILQRSFQTPHR